MKFVHLKKKWLWHLIGPVVVIVAFSWAGPAKVWEVLSKAEPKFLAAAIVLTIPIALIKGIRWRILLGNYDIKLGFADSTSMYATGMVFSAVTPGRVGDLVKIAILIKRGFSVAKAIACSILDRLYDVGAVLLAGYGGMWYFSGQFASQLRIINICGVAVMAAAAVFVARQHLIKKLAIKLIPSQYHLAARKSWNEITEGFWKDKLGRNFLVVTWTILFWLIQFSAIYLCGLAVGLNAPFIYTCACAAVATVLSLLPITVAGVGTRDAVFILLLGQIGISRQQSLAFSALVLTVFLLNCVIFYLISVIFKPKRNLS